MLVAKNINKSYRGTEILKGVDIKVEHGKITSLIGPSGSGKTTLLRVLSMLDLPESGSVFLNDEKYEFPLGEKKIIKPWPRISVVFQQLFLWPHLTLRQNILLPLTGNVDNRHLAELIKLLKMEEFIDRYPNQASIGQRQRVALARALALKPEYLLLDEITSALDVEQSNIILSHLAQIKEMGVGILMVAHDINFAISMADDVCFIEEGKIVKQGKPYEFLLESKNQRITQFIDSASLGSSQIRIYSGKEEFQAYHLSLLERLPENSSITIIGGLGATWYGPMGDKYKAYDEMRVKKHITWDMLMYEYGDEDRRLAKEHPEINKFYILSPSMKNMADININSDGTLLLQIFDPVPTVIEIKNQVLADSYMRYYQDLIKNSKQFLS
jgi:ABC-type polar amino acid transport system ATPase subunit